MKETFVPATDYRYPYMESEKGGKIAEVLKKAVS